jgi:hypothetical protein
MRQELGEAKHKLTEMEHVVRKAERSLDVSRLDQSDLSASLAANVGKLDKLLLQTKSLRQQRADQLVELKAGRRRQKFRLQVCPLPVPLLPYSYLIPTFLVCIEVLQDEALRCNKEKQESNRKKRSAQQKSKQLQKRLDTLRQPGLIDEQQEGGDVDEAEDDVECKWDIRYNRRNAGMKAHFEQHVRCVLATGATARQAQDFLLLDAHYLLPTEEAATFTSSLPQIRWFQDQREALGIESYVYVFMRIAAASRVVQVRIFYHLPLPVQNLTPVSIPILPLPPPNVVGV